MRRSIVSWTCICLLVIIAISFFSSFASASLDSRVEKLEKSIEEIKQSLLKLEKSFFEGWEGYVDKIKDYAIKTFHLAKHHSLTAADTLQKEYPKYLKHAQEATKDLPAQTSALANHLTKESSKHYHVYNTHLTSFLLKQGLTDQYASYLSLGIIISVVATVSLITLILFYNTLYVLCCCGGKKTKTQIKKDKKAAHANNVSK